MKAGNERAIPRKVMCPQKDTARPASTKGFDHGFHGFHGLRILRRRPHPNTIATEANEGNDEELFLRSLRFLLFKTDP
jgi:hypothetical protein